MPAGLPCGKPGMGEEMEGAVQQAAQPGLQFIGFCSEPRLSRAKLAVGDCELAACSA